MRLFNMIAIPCIGDNHLTRPNKSDGEITQLRHAAYLTKEVNPSFIKPPLEFNVLNITQLAI